MSKRFAVIGDPVAHSLSPDIHRAAYTVLGVDWQYDRVRVPESEFTQKFTAELSGFSGLSVTMPLKKLAYSAATVRDAVAAATGFANTLCQTDTGWVAANTDVGGLVAALRHAGFGAARHTCVLGSGATAVTAILAAAVCGAHSVTCVARRESAAVQAAQLAQQACDLLGIAAPQLSGAALTAADYPAQTATPELVISTLPGTAEPELPALLRGLPLYDVSYAPSPSGVAKALQPSHLCDGRTMLVEQAILQLRIFTNGSADTPLSAESAVRDAAFAAVGIG